MTAESQRWELPDDCGEMPPDYVTEVVAELERRGVTVVDSHSTAVQIGGDGWLTEWEECYVGWSEHPTQVAIVITSETEPHIRVYAHLDAVDRTDPAEVGAAIADALPAIVRGEA